MKMKRKGRRIRRRMLSLRRWMRRRKGQRMCCRFCWRCGGVGCGVVKGGTRKRWSCQRRRRRSRCVVADVVILRVPHSRLRVARVVLGTTVNMQCGTEEDGSQEIIESKLPTAVQMMESREKDEVESSSAPKLPLPLVYNLWVRAAEEETKSQTSSQHIMKGAASLTCSRDSRSVVRV